MMFEKSIIVITHVVIISGTKLASFILIYVGIDGCYVEASRALCDVQPNDVSPPSINLASIETTGMSH